MKHKTIHQVDIEICKWTCIPFDPQEAPDEKSRGHQ